jgi:hypothetical protein
MEEIRVCPPWIIKAVIMKAEYFPEKKKKTEYDS